MGDYFEDRLKLHRLYFEARQQQNGYFEKLALLNAATVSLVITAALGKFPVVLKHKYTLGVALTSLVFAMLALLFRNHVATQYEFHEAGGISDPTRFSNKQVRERELKLEKRINFSQTIGVALSALGVFLLLIEAWLVLTS
jgi:hypothetical protein